MTRYYEDNEAGQHSPEKILAESSSIILRRPDFMCTIQITSHWRRLVKVRRYRAVRHGQPYKPGIIEDLSKD